jgi:hypothetical protein
VLLPHLFYVGDRVEARVKLRVETADIEQPAAPAELPDPEWGTIHRVSITGSGRRFDVRISFTPFRPGTLTFPPLDFGSLTLHGVDFHVASILEEDSPQLSPMRDQLVLPSTRFFIAMAATVLVLVPVAILAFYPFIRRQFGRVVGYYRAGRPYRKLRRSLNRLRQDAAHVEGRTYYIRLLDEGRRYLTRKLGVDCVSATTRELETMMVSYIANEEDRGTLLSLFHMGDLVKFAQRPAPIDKRVDDADMLLEIAWRLERRRSEERRLARAGA